MPTMNGTAWFSHDGPDKARSPGLRSIGLATAVAGCHRAMLKGVKARRTLAGLCYNLGKLFQHFRSSGAVVRIAKREKPQSHR